MILSATDCLCGSVSLTLPPDPKARHIRAGRPRRTARRGAISRYSPKSKARFTQELQTAEISWPHAAALTLRFRAGTTTPAAKREAARMFRVLRRRLPGCYGWTSVEYKAAATEPHFHVLLVGPAHLPASEVMAAVREMRGRFPGLVAYAKPVISLAGWTRYLAKNDGVQREAPAACGKTGRFWSRFGRAPSRPVSTVTVPAVAQPVIRAAVAHLVARQGGRRSAPVAHAVAASSGRVSVYLGREQWNELRKQLHALAREAQPQRGAPRGAQSRPCRTYSTGTVKNRSGRPAIDLSSVPPTSATTGPGTAAHRDRSRFATQNTRCGSPSHSRFLKGNCRSGNGNSPVHPRQLRRSTSRWQTDPSGRRQEKSTSYCPD